MLHDPDAFRRDCVAFLQDEIAGITDALPQISPSEWVEANRNLPGSVTNLPGRMSYKVTPYLTEIVNCFDVRSPVREVTVMKGAQVGFTVGVLESVVGYNIGVVRSAPLMYLAADKGAVNKRLHKNLMPMIESSGLIDRIQASGINKQRKGVTAEMMEWDGGGYMILAGARNPDDLRSSSIQCLLMDEIDTYAHDLGGEGFADAIAERRTASYWTSRKIARISTPLAKGTSRIEKHYLDGDQRKYMLPCKHCGKFQELRFRGPLNKETGEYEGGLFWRVEDDRVVEGSVVYQCRYCGGVHTNADKSVMLPKGYWQPTAEPKVKHARSYHLSALYAPAEMYPWESVVEMWREAFSDDGKIKSTPAAKVFYNTILGLTWEEQGQQVGFEHVSAHRRPEYVFGQVPSKHAIEHAGGPIAVLTCSVDVHDHDLAVSVKAWSPRSCAYLVDYWRFEGDCDRLDDPATWGRLYKLLINQRYTEGSRQYGIGLTLIDSGYKPDVVQAFCSKFASGVVPILGRPLGATQSGPVMFKPFAGKHGQQGFMVNVDYYKGRWAGSLRREWSNADPQSEHHFNAPLDATDAQLKELTVERRVRKYNKATGQTMGVEWKRSANVANELWDLLVYNNAALEILAHEVCKHRLGLDKVDWPAFWTLCEREKLFYRTVH